MEEAREHTALIKHLSKGRVLAALLAYAFCYLVPGAAQARDRHAGYYYPEPQTIETYKVRARILPGANRERRIDFVVGLNKIMLKRPYAPEYSVFVKGKGAEKLIIVANQQSRLDTIYRIRGLLATLTSVARAMPIFKQHGVGEILTFFDLIRMLGFKQITVSDGDKLAHQVVFK